MIRSWILYLFLLFLTVLLSILVPFRLFLFLVPALLLLPCVLFLILLYQKKHLSVSLSAKEKEGEVFDYLLTVKNSSIFPLFRCRCLMRCVNRLYEEENKLKLTFPVSGRTSRRMQGELILPSVGGYTLSLERVFISDWFSFFSLRLAPPKEIPLIHWPKNLPHLLSDTLNQWVPWEQDADSAGTGGRDLSQISGLREYHPGDRLQSVHWKLSSKRDDYIVKEFPRTGTKKLTLLAELTYPAPKEVYDAYFSLVFSTADSLVQKGFPFTICWYSPEEEHLREYLITSQDELLSMFRDWLFLPLSRYGERELSLLSPHHAPDSRLICLPSQSIYQQAERYESLFSEFAQPVYVLQPEFEEPKKTSVPSSVKVVEIPLSAFAESGNQLK